MEVGSKDRHRFYVELKPGETTIVSWKKLLRDSNFQNLAVKAKHPPAQSDHSAQGHPHESTSNSKSETNHLSAVVEKIDRLYVELFPCKMTCQSSDTPSLLASHIFDECKQSSDEEELDDVPNEDQYDTEDSFINDNELDEYFEVDKTTPRYDGYFINKGQLEHLSEPNLSSDQQPTRRMKNTSRTAGVKKYDRNPLNDVSLYNACSDPLKLESFTKLYTSTGNYENVPQGKLQNQLDEMVGYSPMDLNNHNMKSDCSYSKISAQDCHSVKTDKSEKQNIGSSCSSDSLILKNINVSSSSAREIHMGKNVFGQADPLSDAPMSITIEPGFSVNSLFADNKRSVTLPDLNYPAPSPETSFKRVKDGSNIGKKGTMLERAIRDLEIIVAQSMPMKMVVQNADTSFVSTKRRLPCEVKQKLAKVARLAQSSQGQISEELINQLMNILGHMVQLRTLKRNLRKMVLLGLSAKREKADSFEKIKREVIGMIKMRRSKQQDVTSGHLLECPHLEENCMDDALEDKICDLYDLYVQGMDEDKGPHIRKLYVELAELWPNGSMDKHGIKKAISRSKDRKRVLCNHEKDQDEAKRKRTSTMKTEDMIVTKASSIAQLQTVKKRQISSPSVYDSTGLIR